MIELIMLIGFFKNLLYQPANLFRNNLNNDLHNAQVVKAALFEERSFQNIKHFKINPEKITAEAVLIKEIDGPVIFQKNSEIQRPIASLTKLMTSLVALSLYTPEIQIEVDKNYSEIQTQFQKGEKFSLSDLLHALLISSSNAAAEIIQVPIGKERFVNKMNEYTQLLGLSQTTFEDNTGLSNFNRSSLKDLYSLAKYIIKNKPEIFAYSRKDHFILKGKTIRYLYNTNKLTERYQSIIFGSKTGFTEEAGQCLIMIVKFERSPLIFIGLLNSQNRETDGEYIIKALREYYK